MEHVLASATPAAASKKLRWTGRVRTGLMAYLREPRLRSLLAAA